MKIRVPLLLTLLFLLPAVAPAASSSEQAPLLPESLAARTEMAASQKTLTIFLKAEDPVKATEELNKSNEEYARKGWTVFSILPYTRDEDFRGFFVTYQKNLILE